ncbi:type II toxin-antitoxin system RelE/ParE family toxin [Sphingobium soli]|uniref:Type II toxin-antitoxin system RelE/ParE family toxin n=1 Tax=Sphingobium soli TaxID=1591116 RepID=A0ABS8HCT0_9SPHN|nr:type II toxin-antitoxin system RelE/ParE family toxin [Sphingobium soli]MCC4234873.1 type II toxin-antitoxin system RelE/ParE family toxin [Sphingobium soli]
MLPVVWRASALRKLEQVIDYIEMRNPTATDRIGAAIRHAADRLPDHPYLHRPGRVPGTREAVVHPNYILVYHVMTDRIQILAFLHTRQQYP